MKVSKVVLATRLVAFACATAFCLGPSVSWPQTYPEETVQHALNLQGGYTGVLEKRLERLGDASAVALTKFLANKPIADADIPPILLVVRLSYESPISIEDAADRKPGTTLFVLSSLSHATTDPETIKKIADTTVFVKAQYTSYLKAHPTN